MTDPQNLATAYTYDTLNRLSTLAFNGQTPAFGFGYDALSRRTSLTRPNGVNTTYAYDPISRLTSILHKLGTTTLDGATYTYDNAGNRKTRTDKRLNTTLTYGYDNIYQLLSAKQGATTKETYTYDAVGNRLSSLGLSPYSYNTSNELTALPSGSYTYDNNGNTKTKPDGTQYTWDYENRLAQVALPGTGGTVNFKYDPFGRRIQKAFTQNGTTTITNYVYDGNNLLDDVDLNGNLLTRFTQSLYIDEPLDQVSLGTTSYYDSDGVGSTSSLSNSAGAVANTYTYDSFGKLVGSTGSISNPFQYAGRELDPETGSYFDRAGFYDQNVGRFLSEDPRKEVLRGLNFYAYVRNNPVAFTDPSGRSPSDWWEKLWGWLGFGKNSWNAAASTMDWSLCGLYYTTCLNQGLGIKADIAQALNSSDPVQYATALATLAEQTGSNSESQMNVNVCMHNDNCQKALQCSRLGLTNPFPFPVR